VPPEIISELLRASLELPLPEDIEALVIHHENSAGTVARLGAPSRAHQDSVGTRNEPCAGMRIPCARPNVSGSITFTIAGCADQALVSRIWNARRVDARSRPGSGVPRMGMRSVRAQAGATCVSSRKMQLIAGIRHVHLADDCGRSQEKRIDVDERPLRR